MSDLCGCFKCVEARAEKMREGGVAFHKTLPGPGLPGWRYGCATCGNKRCLHHSDHTLACTNSNEPGQPGSAFR